MGPPIAATDDDPETAAAPSTEKKEETFLEAVMSDELRPFVIISTSYLLFTITDGAIRMIVLVHAYQKLFTAMEVSLMFTMYELAGVFTNLVAGIAGAKWGIRWTLLSGLYMQLFSFGMLFFWRDDWSKLTAILYVTFGQMFAGIAKDLTKLGGKTVTKLVTPEGRETRLFKLVSLITGWKNSLKGVGYFLGTWLIGFSYETALWSMIFICLLAMPWAQWGLDPALGTAKKQKFTLAEVFVFDNANLNWLSLARGFLFASRDFWFEVPLPFFLRSPSCVGLGETPCAIGADDCTRGADCSSMTMMIGGFDEAVAGAGALEGVCVNSNDGGGCGGLGLSNASVGAFLAFYIILYGQVQSWTPQLVTGPLGQTPPNKLTGILWASVNCLPTGVMWWVMTYGTVYQSDDLTAMTTWMLIFIVTFAVIFAINSSIHSYQVVKYSPKDKISVSVGFYYMSNAVGRLVGTLGGGLLYTYVGDEHGPGIGNDGVAGMAAILLAGTICSLFAMIIPFKIDDQDEGLRCGECLPIVPPSRLPTKEDALLVVPNEETRLLGGSKE